ncbi:MAG: hypothetical protein ACHQ1H_08770, partial [Nitrososphaerales archaeon]
SLVTSKLRRQIYLGVVSIAVLSLIIFATTTFSISGVPASVSLPSAPQQAQSTPKGVTVSIREPSPEVPLFTSAGSTGSNTYWVGGSSNDNTALTNTGVRATIQVISFNVGAACLSYWVSDELSNSMWGQVGYYICQGSSPIAFYQIWNLATNTVITTGTTAVSTGTHTFTMSLQSGTTWGYYVDNTLIGSYNMGSSISVPAGGYPVYALSEEGYTGSPFTIPQVSFPTAILVLKSGAWSPVQLSTSYGSSWGVEGNHQNSNLNVDALLIGGNVPIIPAGSTLWNGMSTSTTSSSSSSTVSTTTTVDSTTSASSTSSSTSTVTTSATTTTSSTSTTSSSSSSTQQSSYAVTFQTSGLPSGTSYSVTIDGIYTYSTTTPNSIVVSFNSGTTHTYSFQSSINMGRGLSFTSSAQGTVRGASTIMAAYASLQHGNGH